MRQFLVITFALSACSVDLPIPDGATITCSSGADCPDGFTCLTAISECVEEGRPDQIGPVLQSVVPLSEFQLDLTFSEPVAPGGAEDPAHYEITPALAVDFAAVVGPQTVRLLVAEQTPGQEYTVQAAGVRDLSGNVISPTDGSQMFIGYGIVPDDTPPDLLSPPQHAIIDSSSALLVWSARLGADTFFVEVARDAEFTDPVSGSPFAGLPGEETSIVVENLPLGEAVHWRVRADTTAPATATPTDPWSAVPLRTLHTLTDTIHIYCPAADACGPPPMEPTLAEVESGNPQTPYRGVQRGLDAAALYAKETVWMANRDTVQTPYLESVVIPPGITLRGGFDPGFSTSDPADPTVIAAEGTVARLSNARGDAATVLENLHIRGPVASTQISSTALAVTESDSALEIRDCVLEGGRALQRSVGLWVAWSAGAEDDVPEISESTVRGGTANESVGMFIDRAGIVARNNEVSASGSLRAIGISGLFARYGVFESNELLPSAFSSYGVHWDSPPTGDSVIDPNIGYLSLVENEIHPVGVGEVYGVFYRERFRWDDVEDPVNDRLQILGNYIATEGGHLAEGIALEAATVPSLVANNVVVPSGSTSNITVRLQGGQETLFVHNTLVAPSTAFNSYLLVLDKAESKTGSNFVPATPTLVNNLMVNFGADWFSYTVVERSSESDMRAVLNNVVVPGTTALVADLEFGDIADFAVADRETVCCGTGGPSTACSDELFQEDNIVTSLTPDELFVDFDGPDDNIATWADNDWHLATTDAAILDGGRDTSTAGDCGLYGQCPPDISTCGSCDCGSITVDIDGAARDATPTPGAYQH